MHVTKRSRPKPWWRRPLIARLWRLLDHFRVDGDIDVIADDHAAVVHCGVPLHAKVLAIDF